jgi:integrase/recombinase XerD
MPGSHAFVINNLQLNIDSLGKYLLELGMSQAIQGLLLYKVHTPNCHVHDSRVPAHSRRFYFKCQCPIYIKGRTPSGDTVPRQSTGFSDLKKAEGLRDSLMADVKGNPTSGPALAECIEKYLASRAQELDERTLDQHRVALERLRLYLAAQGIFYVHDLTVDHLETFKTAGLPSQMKGTTRATADAKIRCFLRTAFRRGWLKEHLVERVTPVKAVYEEKEPYSDEEVKAILDEALKLDGGTRGYAKHPGTFRLLLELMLETGMRVGDAVRFDPKRLEKGDTMWIYNFTPAKQKRAEKRKTLEAYIPDGLKRRIDECQWLTPDGPFWYGSSKDPDALAQAVYERMQGMGQRCGISDCRPHRLRDTFAVRKLLAGMQLEDVSRLLGHSSIKITETYYARWTSGRKRRLERILNETLVNA